MKVHLIATGGSAMHNLAIALHKKGIQVTGSDDEIVDPAKSNLQKYGLMPATEGWDPARITSDLDAVILGMHAHADNPELKRAQELKLKIYSYPEYLYEQTKNKTRVVIGGSHGKTTITAMVLHALKYNHKQFDYLVGAALEGFETSLHLSNEAPIAVFEGDEYLSSTLDKRPKFLLYKPQIALISGIAWDHVNVFPTYQSYLDQFEKFVKELPADGTLVYCDDDLEVHKLAMLAAPGVKKVPYGLPNYSLENGITFWKESWGTTQLEVFGKHNLLNLNGAKQVCQLLGLTDKQFLEAIASFKGAARRLQTVARTAQCTVYWDFAHSPSKLKATIQAVKEQFPKRKLVACMELHTFSSLTKEFLKEYLGTMDLADVKKVYFNPHVLEHKRLPSISPDEVKRAFGGNIEVYTDSKLMVSDLRKTAWKDTNLLMMSSGNFDGVNIKTLAEELTKL
ncbi:MAG TPA: Mur ligase family protein [Bacteroidia bacterium]|jgi:UDP-N-acetylmuramate: L-alanyl-gamma-D-glutamyl-meso-diaminopimelate ligase|nr:Mur ligase family protein [Bacteroidia bacterium]